MKFRMLALSTKPIKRKMKIANTSKGRKTVSGFFDFSLSTAVEPGHLLTGLILTSLHTAFIKAPMASETMRLQHQFYVLPPIVVSIQMGHFCTISVP